MDRHHVRQLLDEARVSRFEEHSFLTGILLLAVATAEAVIWQDPAGPAGVLGMIGLVALGVCAISRGVRLYRANVEVSLPESVGKVSVRVRPRLLSTAATAAFALVLPGVTAVAFVAALDWGWLAIAGLLLFGCLRLLVNALRSMESEPYYWNEPDVPSVLLERLCMRAVASA